MPKKPRQPFELTLSKDDREQLALELSRALDDALAVRSVPETEVAYWHTLYEQGRTRGPNNSPWADAADLTSPLGTFYVDVLRSMIVQTVFSDTVWTVEGYGESETKAPFVEEFHQWQQEAEGFQGVFSRAAHLALIEPRGVIEVYEDTIKRPVRKVIKAALQLGVDGAALVDAKLNPVYQQNEQGGYVEATEPDPLTGQPLPSADLEIDAYETVCRGPRERVIPYRDYLQLPGHALEKAEVWGHFKRFYRRLDELTERVEAGQYDEDAVKALGTDDERPSDTTLANEPIGVAAKDGTDLVEKELWEGLILRDLDGKGPRWFVVTLHKDKQQILRIQYDDIGRPRYFPLVPFPRPHSTEGYSYIGHKLITVIEEHTAWRNMLADDAAIQLQLPIKRKTGALWDPDTEPIGPKMIIPVRAPDDVTFMERQNNTAVGIERSRDVERFGERLSGINDAASGITSENKRTLGEIELITQQSMGRTSEAVKNIQETLEEIAQVRHLMWKRALSEMGSEGLAAPPSVSQSLQLRTQQNPMLAPMGAPTGELMGLETRAPDISQAAPNVTFTAQMLEGHFRFKPKGSVESADKNRQRYDFNQWLISMANMAKVNPMVGAIMGTPMAAKAMIEQGVRLYNVQDKQAFLGQQAMLMAMQSLQAMALQPQVGAPPMSGAPSTSGASDAGARPPQFAGQQAA